MFAYCSHTVLIQGEPGIKAFYILSGYVQIYKRLPETPVDTLVSSLRPLLTLGRGMGLGEIAITTPGHARSATVRVEASCIQCELLVFDREDFMFAVRIEQERQVSERLRFFRAQPVTFKYKGTPTDVSFSLFVFLPSIIFIFISASIYHLSSSTHNEHLWHCHR